MIERRLYPTGGIHAQVAHDIGRRVVSGEIAEGSFLPREAELAEQFSASRQAVREALKVLAAKGLVFSRRRTGTRVLPRSSWNLLDPDVLAWHSPEALAARLLNDLDEVRRLIEPAAAAFAASRANPESIDAISAALNEMRQTIAQEEFHQADVQFHAAVFAASGNQVISRLGDLLGPLLQASFRIQDAATDDTYWERVVPLHEAVFDAIMARDPAKARRCMEEMLDVAAGHISQFRKA